MMMETSGRALRIGLVAAAITAGCAVSVAAGTVNDQGGAAIGGYDPVAYFEEGRPVKGSPAHTVEHEGVVFRFSTEARRAAFAADPARYAPRYGGWCAYGMARGYKATIDPTAFTFVEGRLYLNYSEEVQALWRTDIPGHVETADRNWPRVRDQ